MRIVFVTSEATPFAKTGGLADVCGTLPIVLEQLGHEVSIIMPYYKMIGPKENLNDRVCFSTIGQSIKVFFIKNKNYFGRDQLYGDSNGDYPDNLDRFSFFSFEALKLLKELGHPIDIIHCHDWQTALVPLLLRDRFISTPCLSKTRTVFTIHNLAYQGLFPHHEYYKLGIADKYFTDDKIEFYGKINLLKAGIVYSDFITTVSPQYAKDIQSKEYGFGLDGVLQANKHRLAGILNGLDYDLWNPEQDRYIDPPYSSQDQLAKKIQKENLQKLSGLSVIPDIPVFGFLGRLCYQKGFDLIESAFDELMLRPIQLVFMGVGDDKYQKLLKKLSKRKPQQFAAIIRYDEDIAHQVIAGSDFFLMPSVYEPCGLAQMIALRYGTVPVVTEVGGLQDSVVDFSTNKQHGNGFLIHSYSVSGLLEAIDRAVGSYNHKEKFAALIAHGMSCRFTWQSSANHYVEVYQECLS